MTFTDVMILIVILALVGIIAWVCIKDPRKPSEPIVFKHEEQEQPKEPELETEHPKETEIKDEHPGKLV